MERSKEVALQHDLSVMRESISQFYSDQNRYPGSLEELVQLGYLKSIPVDPITQSKETWIIVGPPEGALSTGVYDIYSGAGGYSIQGTPFSSF